MRTIYCLAITLLFIPLQLFSQATYQVTGDVKDANNEGIAFANVLLLRASDSTLVKGALTSETGSFIIENVLEGKYYIKSSVIGYQGTQSEVFDLKSNFELPVLFMQEGESLEEVLIIAEKPLFTQKVDRLVINVEGSIVSSGGTALEVLERSPGVVVNRQSNNISVVGKDGVVVMINGKTSYVPTDSLVQLLGSMSSDNIESIELITTPPANFDAEGNAGFINIVLKKTADLGLNGSYSLSGGYGDGETTSDNINFNYRKDKINLFGSYSFSIDKRSQFFETTRQYLENDTLKGVATKTNRDPRQRNHNLRLGLDVQISEKTIMGVLLNGFDNRWSMDAFNENVETVNGSPISFVDIVNDEINHLRHFGANYNIKHNFTADEYISMDLDYLYYKFENPTNYTNSFFDENENFLFNALLRSDKTTPITTLVGKIDYSKKVNDKFSYEAGIKGTNSALENDVSVEDKVNGVYILDPTLTNFSNLDESILAAYTAVDYSFNDKTSAKVGLRYEHTNSLLVTNTQGVVVDRNYGIWFPSVFFNRKITDDLTMNLSYSKRITRPTFNDLAPFVIFFDPSTFISGNASLQPAISNSFKYDINYKSYFLSFGYTNQDASIASFQETIDEETGRLFFVADNLDYTRTFSVIAGVPVKIASWWRTQNNLTFIKQKVRAFYLGEPVVQDLGNFSANSTHSFKITESFTAELSGFYSGPSFFGTARYEEVYGINIGFQKKFNDKWGTLKFSINDALDSVEFVGGTNLPDQNIFTKNVFDFSNRTFLITYSRNFGNSKLKSSRNRETGSEDERRRVN
ncbi:TonB-dependent receptor family protein [Aureisphaera sp. CAU 1614]|uniref:TonB-dependent receptor family protein n=1 Tax=Halomarinibacterium sedimenti TaxID=2857106 RepID=A0A9X1FQH9_9FLAO|nr:outer membrane beta-barrel family protein [Halomarinibacterium sedimenti]MBW2938007.1 TonB-dependent receptor family protein [Halomarinibacterium sedimenti]